MIIACLECGKPVKTIPARIKQGRGKFCSQACYHKRGRPDMKGANHHLWKGDSVGYTALHAWVRRTLGKPSLCENCGITTAKKYEWANISGEYKRDVTDWARLCTSCHNYFDNTNKGKNRKG